MFRPQALVLYKNRPAIVAEVRDRIEIKLEDGSSARVRDKDIALLHPGPVSRIPAPAADGDFETARRMLAGVEGGAAPDAEPVAVGWDELSELVFGHSGPEEALACLLAAQEGLRFRLADGAAWALSDAESAREAEKRARKEGEAAERRAFVERAKRASSQKRDTPPAFEPGDSRFLSELEALAYGKASKSRIALELGLSETPEAAQAFLLRTGRWDEFVNPHPQRAGCPLAPPRIPIGPEAEAGPRVDLTGLEAWAIDNAWSKDPDDAIGWDGDSVWIHVADPAAAIMPDSPADQEAFARGSTLYLPELTAPMLSDEALERFGLGLAPVSPALSFRVGLSEDGSIARIEVMASRVAVKRLSYEEADARLARGELPGLAELARLAALRSARRAANGAVEIDIPEVRIAVDLAAGPDDRIRITALPRTGSSGLVRELMLLAGEAAARWAFERSLPFPFYGQEAPAEGGSAAEGSGLAAQFARRRLMRPGITGPTPTSHRGLGLPFYAQATSPLRRYQDLLGHMQIRAVLAGRAPLDADEVGRRCALAQASSAATRQAERASDLHWTLAYLSRRPGWTGEAAIVGAAGPGAWVAYLPALGLETRVKLGPGRSLDEVLRLRLARVDLAALESSFDEAP